ncbi:MAG TPA: hypothetical protein DCZ95_09920 [Verrucomicrobia bacterium]|nr:MAG: hypothetical protein A2X46_00140 [Lentisphaerae bacterium GWF2_57_35]HBA84397.1 hypothetical protein [Verrucomicrobiota bacterium]
MPRPWRQQFEGATYHITVRGNGREKLFYEPEDYERFIEQLEQALKWERVVLYAYALMSNHYHLLIETPEGNLSKFMQRLNTAYGQYFRYKRRRPGHCMQGRFGAKRVEGDEYLARVTRYIHLNPVKIKSMKERPAKERLEALKTYRWSSGCGYAGWAKPEKIIDYRWLDLMRGRSLTQKRKAYARYLAECLEADDERLKEVTQKSAYAIGDEEFVAQVESEAEKARQEAGRFVELHRPAADGMPIEQALQFVGKAYGLKAEDFLRHGRGLGEAKSVAVELVCCVCGMSQRAVGQRLGVSPHAVSKLRKRLALRLRQEPELQQRMGKMLKDLKSIVDA